MACDILLVAIKFLARRGEALLQLLLLRRWYPGPADEESHNSTDGQHDDTHQ